MRKRGFNLVEIVIVIVMIVTTVLLCLPAMFNNTKQARLISVWKGIFFETKSNFEIFALNERKKIDGICYGNMPDKKELIYGIIKPYLNLTKPYDAKILKGYTYKYYNGKQIMPNSIYYAQDYGLQENGTIVGFRWLGCECSESTPCATAIFDVNGTKKPNLLGQDVFGIYIFKNGIEAFGYDLSNDEIEKSCNLKKGNGASCSEYYLRGGRL